MSGISNFGSLDSLDSLTNLVTKLPLELHWRWVVKSVEIQSITGFLAKLKHVVEFVQQVLKIDNLLNLVAKSDKSRGGKVSLYGISNSYDSMTSQKESNSLLKLECAGFATKLRINSLHANLFFQNPLRSVLLLSRTISFVTSV